MRQDRKAALVLVVMSGPAQGMKIPLNHAFLLGRDGSSRVPLNDERVSRHHAVVEVVDHQPVIKDLGSKNGTFVNGLEIREPRLLQEQDRIRIGKTLMMVMEGEATPVPLQRRMETDAADILEVTEQFPERADDSPLPPPGHINRIALRRASHLASQIARMCDQNESLLAILVVLREEFQGDAAAVFSPSNVSEPVCNTANGAFWQHIQAKLTDYLLGNTFSATVIPAPSIADASFNGSYLLFFLRLRDQRPVIFLIRRPMELPFQHEDVQLAEAVSECLRLVPLQDYFRPRVANSPEELSYVIVGSSRAIAHAREQALSFAATEATVLIVGESGTGKELFAEAIARGSERSHGPYVVLNSACMQPELMESELFGHEQGAFTGAYGRKLGKLEMADGGTLFLDEIGELPLDLQAKLLRVLEGQPFYRLGGGKLIHADVRFICATNRNLEKSVEKGEFRRDLYHRINILRLEVPPLRDRLEDIPELAEHFLRQFAAETPGKGPFTLTPKALRRLLSHNWDGNVRELRNVLQRMTVFSQGGELDENHIPQEIGRETHSTTMKLPRLQVLTEMIEREEISRALVEARGAKLHAARLLGISRPTLDKKIRLYNLDSLVHSQRAGEEADEDQSD